MMTITPGLEPSPRTIVPGFIRGVPCFRGLDEDVLGEVARLLGVKYTRKGEILWLEQEPARTVYFLESGMIKLFKTSSGGREQILRLIYPGDCFGHAGALNGGSHPECASALTDSVLYGIEKKDLLGLVERHPQISFNFIKLLTSEMHHYMSLVEDLSLRCVSGRLARMLLENAGDERNACSSALTRADMAAMTGTVREVIGKSLRAMEDRGIIRYDRHRIEIRDREALETIMLDTF